VDAAVQWLDVLFGKGDDDYPFWLFTVRINVLLFVVGSAIVLAAHLLPSRLRRARFATADVSIALALTGIAAVLRIIAEHNLSDVGGIGYSRILFGYKGHFGAAQLYSLVYARGGRTLETAILLNRIAGTLTVPLVYALCRRVLPASRAFAVITAALVSLHPLHVLFSATDALPIITSFLAAASYLFLLLALDETTPARWERATAGLAAATGLALLTQVRYENVLFLAPAAIYVVARRHAPLRLLGPATVFTSLIVVYAVAALRSGSSFHTPVRLDEVLPPAARELFGNPIFAIAPLLVGTAAAMVDRRSRVRALAPLPLIAVFVLMTLAGKTEGHHLARTYVNEVLLLALAAGYGLALMWESSSRIVRTAAAACVLSAAILPFLFWPNLRERHLETAEHDFFRATLAALPPGIDRVVVPDDDLLLRETHATIESQQKYRMIAAAAGSSNVELVGLTRFLERPADLDCSRGNCAFFRGVPCLGLPHYWFAETECTQLMTTRAGPPLVEEEVVAGSFVDCSVYRGAARRRVCDPVRRPQRLGLYRITNGGAPVP
jgi:hypothetical protein